MKQIFQSLKKIFRKGSILTMRPTIKLLVGCPASGKTSWARDMERHATVFNEPFPAYVSRDDIRFKIVKETEEYFSKEKEVFNTFINTIQELIDDRYPLIIVDATHVTKASRKKVLNQLDLKDYKVDIIVLRPSLETCLERNTKREGRACVPETALINMYNSYEQPTEEEFDYIKGNKGTIFFYEIN